MISAGVRQVHRSMKVPASLWEGGEQDHLRDDRAIRARTLASYDDSLSLSAIALTLLTVFNSAIFPSP
jgi:hypothetical protein